MTTKAELEEINQTLRRRIDELNEYGTKRDKELADLEKKLKELREAQALAIDECQHTRSMMVELRQQRDALVGFVEGNRAGRLIAVNEKGQEERTYLDRFIESVTREPMPWESPTERRARGLIEDRYRNY